MSAEEAIQRARAALIVQAPFYGTLALGLELVHDDSFPTMATDGRRIVYNEAFTLSLAPSELRAVMAHEVMHVANLHHVRRGTRDPKRWNEACDYAVNRDLIAAGFRLPKGALVNPAYDGLGAEEIYRQLQAAEKAQGGNPPPPKGGKPGDDPGACGAVLDAAPAHEPAALAEAEAETRAKVRQAINVAKAHNSGKIPADLERVTEETAKPNIDWQSELRRFIDDSVVKDSSWSRPNRRYLSRGLYLPGMVADSLAHIVLVIDTSGSIDAATLAAFRAEIGAALDEGAADKVTVVYCDAKVQGTAEFERGDVLALKPVGGGGTRFSPAFRWIDENAADASAIVYFTDLVVKDWGDEPAAPVIWAAWGDPRAIAVRGAKAPFGEVLHLAV